MNFSNKVTSLTIAPKFLNRSKTELNHLCHVHLDKLNIDILIFFNTVKKDELEVELANYYTDYKGEYLGVIDAFFALIQHRPLEAIDRFPIKELDYYLRDSAESSAFSGYSQEIYEIISLGESIKNKIYGEKKIGFQYDPKVDGDFFDLSTSEQYELLEEFFAYYVYGKQKSEQIDIIDINDCEIVLKFVDDRLKSILAEKLFLKPTQIKQV